MPNAVLSMVLGSMLVLSAMSVTLTSDAYAKTLPSSRPDLVVSIGIAEREIVHEDGSTTYDRKFATEGNFLLFYNDVGKLHRIFDRVIVPAIEDFVEKHKTQLADKTIDQISIEYDISSNTVSVSLMGTQVSGAVQVDPLSTDKAEIATDITVRIPVSVGFDWPGNYSNLSYDILPNASVRVAYLTVQMQEILEKHKEKIVTDVTHDDQGAEIGKILYGVSSVMFDDMSRTTVSFRDQGYSYIGRTLTEYDSGVQLVVPVPPSTSSFYQNVAFDVAKPVLFAKPVDESIIISTAVALFGETPEIILTYPDGKIVSLRPSKIESDKEGDYKVVELRCKLNASDPEGIYEVFIKAQPDKVVSQNSGSFVTKVNEPNVPDCRKSKNEYVDSMPSEEVVVDRGLVPYQAESWCNYSRLMTVESPDASIFDERTNRWITIYEFLQQFGEFESTWSNVHFDNTDPMYFLHAIKWRASGSPDAIDNAINAFNSLESDMKQGRELSLYLIKGDCISAEGKEFAVETETNYIVRQIMFDQQAKKISYIVDTGERTRGLFKVTIPEELLSGDFTVMVDGQPHYVSESVSGGSNGTHTMLTYWHEGSAKNIAVIGTEVIPEFPFAIVIASLAIGIMIALMRVEKLKIR